MSLPQEYTVKNNTVYKRHMVNRFAVDIMSSDTVVQGHVESWLALKEEGQWLQENSKDLFWTAESNQMLATMEVGVFCYLTEKQHTFYLLKFPKAKSYAYR